MVAGVCCVGRWHIDVPHASSVVAAAFQDGSVVVEHAEGVGFEEDVVSHVTQLSKRQQGTVVEGWHNVGFSCGRSKHREVQVGDMRGFDGGSVGDFNGDGMLRESFVEDRACETDIGFSASGVCNKGGGTRRRSRL